MTNTQIIWFSVTANISGVGSELMAGARDGVAKLDTSTGDVSYLSKFWTADDTEREPRYENTLLYNLRS
jgi:hypothetical protein